MSDTLRGGAIDHAAMRERADKFLWGVGRYYAEPAGFARDVIALAARVDVLEDEVGALRCELEAQGIDPDLVYPGDTP